MDEENAVLNNCIFIFSQLSKSTKFSTIITFALTKPITFKHDVMSAKLTSAISGEHLSKPPDDRESQKIESIYLFNSIFHFY